MVLSSFVADNMVVSVEYPLLEQDWFGVKEEVP